MTTSTRVSARRLTKRFGEFTAVDGIDFEVQAGEVFGFLGPNGAGKSSTMRMVGATSDRSGGELSVLGLDPSHHGAQIRSRLGVVPQEDNLDLELSVADNLYVYGRYFGLPRRQLRGRIAELQLEVRGLTKSERRAAGWSWQRRLVAWTLGSALFWTLVWAVTGGSALWLGASLLFTVLAFTFRFARRSKAAVRLPRGTGRRGGLARL